MHLAEGTLPPVQCATWTIMAAPFLLGGWWRLRCLRATDRRALPLVALMGAAVFIISLLPIPIPWIGTCSHMCGTPLAAVLLGPWLAALLGAIALIFQALLFSHGGISTWGANVVSMAVVGSFSGWFIYTLLQRFRVPWAVAVVIAACVGDLLTYATTSVQLAWGLTATQSFVLVLQRITVMFLPVQAPLAVLEGLMTAWILKAMHARRPELFLADQKYRGIRPAPMFPILGLLLCLLVGLTARSQAQQAYRGIDEAVFGTVAQEGGRTPRSTFPQLGQGDIQLTIFTLGGLLAGIIIGRTSTLLFPRRQPVNSSEHAPPSSSQDC